MEHPLLVYTTFPDVDTALSVGEALVRDKVIACINVLPGIQSLYSWNSSIERGQEAVAILKTRTGLRDEVQGALKARHPYKTPIILFIEPAGADSDTLAWLVSETTGRRASGPSSS
ncbi:divalent-cation tolerance protein CutA [Microvirga sp. 2TAF3]|uniref:divalent-cation tolerance protein CutA n=1 Tax=Microvirga sp. 2TAF3 TaxID=3233014 RepID=UPI003F99D47E